MSSSGPTFGSLTAEEIKEKQAAERKRQQALALQRAQRVVNREYATDRAIFSSEQSFLTLRPKIEATSSRVKRLSESAAAPERTIEKREDSRPKCK